MPLVSVLLPAWNAAATIGRAIGSILAEHDIDLECVVVDDGSGDDTAGIVRELAERDARVRLLALEKNVGVSAARNRGLQMVRGEWLVLLDADDRLLPGALGALTRAALATDALAVIGQRVWTDGQRRWLGPFYDTPDIRQPGRKSLATHPGLLYYAAPHGKLLHRSCWEGVTFEGRALGDQPWTLTALLRAGDRIEVIGDVVYEWVRPQPSSAAEGITATTRSSASRGAEVVGVAIGALETVGQEAERNLPPAAARIVTVCYAERLIRSDLAFNLRGALRRRDPGLPDLLAAIERFVVAAPDGAMGASNALARDILEPPLWSWWRLAPADRAAYASLLRVAHVADPDLVRHAHRSARFAMAHAGASGPAAAAGLALVTVASIARRVLSRVRAASRRAPAA